MAYNSKIEWTHHTDNLWWGCTKVHAGCDNCYAETLANRWQNDQPVWGNENPRRAIKGVFSAFLKQNAEAEALGEMRRVFVGSMMDIAEKSMRCVNSKGEEMEGETAALRHKFFTEIVPNCKSLIFLLLTKRPQNFLKQIPAEWVENPPPNVMYGTSPVDPDTFKNLVPALLKVPGKRFLSIEPQLADLYPTLSELEGIDWVIQGGESGPKRRPFDTDWARNMKAICRLAGIPYFFKQVDKILPIPEDLHVREFPVYHSIWPCK